MYNTKNKGKPMNKTQYKTWVSRRELFLKSMAVILGIGFCAIFFICAADLIANTF